MKVHLIGEPRIIMGGRHYFAWPTVARLQNGKLAVVASGYRRGHICPFGKTVISYSEDEGGTYTAPAPVVDTVLDDRDGGIVSFGESGVMVTSFNNSVAQQRAWAEDGRIVDDAREKALRLAYLEQVDAAEEAVALGSHFCFSYDNGVTFGPLYKSPVTSPHGPIALPDGTFLWVGNLFGRGQEPLATYVVKADGTVERRGDIEPVTYEGVARNSYEPHGVLLEDGRILVHIRVEEAMFTVYQTETCDGGYTWTKPQKLLSDFGGSPAHLLRHSSGVLISTYGFRGEQWKAPFGVRVMFSRDNGVTWDVDHELYVNHVSPDLGYPSTVELADGSLLTVFYATLASESPAVVMQQKWSFDPE